MRSSDLLSCGILMWGQVRGIGLTSDRVDQPQIGARIGKLPGVELPQEERWGRVLTYYFGNDGVGSAERWDRGERWGRGTMGSGLDLLL